ncbi:MAG TPA: ATP-binding protein [Microlunatus sp.]|nr:ATP-binding protein [Microlunatus sp.]
MVGRDAERTILRDFLARVKAGDGAMLVVGAPGVGKSALLEAAAAHAYDLGLDVVRAAGAEFEVGVSFATLNPFLGPFAGLIPQLDPADWSPGGT